MTTVDDSPRNAAAGPARSGPPPGTPAAASGREQVRADDETSARERFYDAIADCFESWMNEFDLCCRLQWVREHLPGVRLGGIRALDVGSGLGHFSRLLAGYDAEVVSLDIGRRLLARSAVPAPVQGSALDLPFADATFDLVVSSECIEHTPAPQRAIAEMVRVLRPGGTLLLTCPNRRWRWSLTVARLLRWRRFRGLENWPSRRAVGAALAGAGARVRASEGLYLLPFHFRPLHPLLRWSNRRAQALRSFMINQCWDAVREPAPHAGGGGQR